MDELLGIPTPDELKLIVQECSSTSFSKVYLSQNVMTKHKIWYASSKVLLTKQGLKTACTFLRDPDPDAVSDIKIRINSAIRGKLGVSVGDSITIRLKEEIPEGNIVCCVPFEECSKDLEDVNLLEAFLWPYFKDASRPVHEGDVFKVIRPTKQIQFKIINIDPSPFCIVGPSTIIECELGSEKLKNEVLVDVSHVPINEPTPKTVVSKVDQLPVLEIVRKLPIKTSAKNRRFKNKTTEKKLEQNNREIDSCQFEDASGGLKRKHNGNGAQAKTDSNGSKFPRLIAFSSKQPSAQLKPCVIDLVTEKPVQKSVRRKSNSRVARVDQISLNNETSTTQANSCPSLENSILQTEENNSLVAVELNRQSSLRDDLIKGQITTTEKTQLLNTGKEAKHLSWIHNLIRKYKDTLSVGKRNSLEVQDWMDHFRKLKLRSATPQTLTNNSEKLQHKLWDSPLLHRISSLLENMRKFGEAIELNKKIHETQKLIHGCDNIKSVSTLFRIAHQTLQTRPQGFRNALPLFKSVFEKRCKILGPHNDETLRARYCIACCLVEDKKFNEARIILEKVLEKQKLECHQKGLEDTEFQIARCFRLLCRYEKAKAMYLSVYKKRKQRLGPHHPETLDVQFYIGQVDSLQYKFQEALATFEAFLPLAIKYLGPQNRRTVDAMKKIKTLKTWLADSRKQVTKDDVNLNELQKPTNKISTLNIDKKGIKSAKQTTEVAQNIAEIRCQGISTISKCSICLGRNWMPSSITHSTKDCPFFQIDRKRNKYKNYKKE